MKKILVFTATYNEKENIKEFLEKLISQKYKFDILIVDDNSPDGTIEIINQFSENINNLKLYIRDKKLGLDTAHKFAFNYAKVNNYDVLITMDADLSHDSNQLGDFLKKIENCDFIIGSRYMLGGKNNMKGCRLFLSIYGNKIIKFFSGIRLTEFTTSYRAFNLKKLQNFDLNKVNAKGYSFFMVTVCMLKLFNYNIEEIPIIFNDRIEGRSKIPKLEIFRTIFNLIKISFKLRLNKN